MLGLLVTRFVGLWWVRWVGFTGYVVCSLFVFSGRWNFGLDCLVMVLVLLWIWCVNCCLRVYVVILVGYA